MKYICSRCGASSDREEKFCGRCGGRVVLQRANRYRICNNCGKYIDPKSAFCDNCGTTVRGKSILSNSSAYTAVTMAAISVIVISVTFVVMIMNICPSNRAVAKTMSVPSVQATAAAEPIPEPTEMPTEVPTAAPTSEPTADPRRVVNNTTVIVEPPREVMVPAPPYIELPPMPQIDVCGAYPDQDYELPVYNGFYVYPSDSSLISDSYLEELSQSEVRLILNEIYARHGYTFSDAFYNAYFNAQPWYVSEGKSMEQCVDEFNYYELENQKKLVAYEKSMGWR